MDVWGFFSGIFLQKLSNENSFCYYIDYSISAEKYALS